MTDKMPFGEFNPEEVSFHNVSSGQRVPHFMPSGYSGLFWGKMFYGNGRRINSADNYFVELARKNGENDEYIYWTLIDAAIEKHCEDYLGPILKDNEKYTYQYGFGGDECDGLIDFWLPKQVPKMPPLRFKILGKKYILRWEYSSGE